MAPRDGICLLYLVALVSSCDLTEEEHVPPPHPVTTPFTCESADNFIRMGDESIGHVFFIGDSTKVFYSFLSNRILKYGLPDLRIKKSQSLPSDKVVFYSCARDETSAWLFTGTHTGSLVANVIDTALNITYVRDLGLPPFDHFKFAPTPDRGFVIAANLYESMAPEYSVLSFSETGALLWREDVASDAYIRTMIARKDDGFLVGGSLYAGAGAYQDNFLTKLSGAGKVLWTRSRDVGTRSHASSVDHVIEDDSGDYFLLIANGGMMNLVRADSAFNIKWSTALDGQYAGNLSTLSASDDGILVLSFQFNGTSTDIFFERYSDDGNLQWKNQYGGTGDEHASAISTIPSGYYLIGDTNNYPEPAYLGVNRAYLIKTDLEGRSCQ